MSAWQSTQAAPTSAGGAVCGRAKAGAVGGAGGSGGSEPHPMSSVARASRLRVRKFRGRSQPIVGPRPIFTRDQVVELVGTGVGLTGGRAGMALVWQNQGVARRFGGREVGLAIVWGRATLRP